MKLDELTKNLTDVKASLINDPLVRAKTASKMGKKYAILGLQFNTHKPIDQIISDEVFLKLLVLKKLRLENYIPKRMDELGRIDVLLNTLCDFYDTYALLEKHARFQSPIFQAFLTAEKVSNHPDAQDILKAILAASNEANVEDCKKLIQLLNLAENLLNVPEIMKGIYQKIQDEGVIKAHWYLLNEYTVAYKEFIWLEENESLTGVSSKSTSNLRLTVELNKISLTHSAASIGFLKNPALEQVSASHKRSSSLNGSGTKF